MYVCMCMYVCMYVHVIYVCRELGDSVTVYQCHFVLAGLHQKERHAPLALRSFQAALALARELRDRGKEAEMLREIAQVCVYV